MSLERVAVTGGNGRIGEATLREFADHGYETVDLARGGRREDVSGGGVMDRRLMPAALVYDPALVATTPPGVRAASAMNGFNKAVETLYSPDRTPVTDGTAVRALGLMQRGFGTLPEADPDPESLVDAVAGVICAQYGVSRPDAVTLGVVHAFGHGLSGQGVHQGRGHAAVTPAVLRELFAQVDGRRRLLAEGLGVETEGRSDEAVADDVVAAVTGIRDALDLPSRLRDLEGLDRADLPAVAETTAADSLMDATPDGFDLSVGDVERVLEDAW